MTKVFELRPNKNLMNRNFEKYQFCADSIPLEIEKNLETEVYQLELSGSQESWLETRLYALHNHLFINPFNRSCYYIDNAGTVWQFTKMGDIKEVHKLQSASDGDGLKYNSSMSFASKNITVVSNGGKHLEFVLEEKSEKSYFIFNDVDSGIIMDSQYVNETHSVIVSIYSIVEYEGKKCSRLTLLTYSYQKAEDGSKPSLTFSRKEIIKVKGTIEYIHVESNGNYFHIASQDPVVFEYDSLYPIQDPKATDIIREIKIPKYCWSQDEDSVTVWLKIPNKCTTNILPKVDVQSTKIFIEVKDVVLIQGSTQHKLESGLATWKVKNDTLEFEFTKSEFGLMWSELIKGDTGGEFLPNEALTAEIHSRLAHLCSDQPQKMEQPVLGFNSEQMEECDLEGRENVLQRLNMNSHSTSNLSILGSSNCVLFTQKTSTGQMLCLRHDHDGCIWVTESANEDQWKLEHIDTFPGFGYVEASKTNKKFCITSTNASFIAIVENTRHIFIYQKPEINASIGKQRIIDFGSSTSSILGAAGIDDYLIILTKNKLYRFHVY